MSNESIDKTAAGWVFGGMLVIACLAAFGLWGCPTYNVWQAEMSGKAEYSKAEYNRRVAVLEAQAHRDAARSLAQAEVERARGVAQANQIIGESLRGNDAYLRYLWIQNLDHGTADVIYIPTEAGLPILEAGRRGETAAAAPTGAP